ncbi:MAG: DsbA family protein [Thermoleophilaceae bacterium]|nr:DsbA family protein [Thermoleophilaceae bacterium]
MERPVFYYDLGSPYSWLAAERVNALFDPPPVWEPVLLGAIFKATGRSSWSRGPGREQGMRECERRAREYGLMEMRWPRNWPGDMLTAMRAATFAKQSGRAVSFSLAAFRQQFNAGRDLSDLDNVLLAAAACELHPRAVIAGIGTQLVKDALRAATEDAIARGVVGVPTIRIGDQLFWGDDRLEEAAAAVR